MSLEDQRKISQEPERRVGTEAVDRPWGRRPVVRLDVGSMDTHANETPAQAVDTTLGKLLSLKRLDVQGPNRPDPEPPTDPRFDPPSVSGVPREPQVVTLRSAVQQPEPAGAFGSTAAILGKLREHIGLATSRHLIDSSSGQGMLDQRAAKVNKLKAAA